MKKEICVLIVGTNNFDDYNFFEEKLYEILKKYFEENYDIIIREQENNLTDSFSIKFSKENNCKLERYKIDWKNFGKSAGFENIKNLVWGKGEKVIDLLLIFQDKLDTLRNNFILTIIEEFKSIIDLENLGLKNYFLFIK